MKKPIRLLTILLPFILILAACNGDDEESITTMNGCIDESEIIFFPSQFNDCPTDAVINLCDNDRRRGCKIGQFEEIGDPFIKILFNSDECIALDCFTMSCIFRESLPMIDTPIIGEYIFHVEGLMVPVTGFEFHIIAGETTPVEEDNPTPTFCDFIHVDGILMKNSLSTNSQ